MKQFITNKYYGLADVHEYNTFLKNLPMSDIDYYHKGENTIYALMENIIKLMSVMDTSDRIADFVPGTESYMRILEKNMLYRTKNAFFELWGVQIDCIAERFNGGEHNTRYIYKITFQWGRLPRYNSWDEGYPDEYYEMYWHNQEYSFHVSGSWFHSDPCYKIIEDITYLLVPYISEDGDDLIQKAIDNIDYLNKLIHAKDLCARLKIDYHEFAHVFRINDLVFYDKFVIYDAPEDYVVPRWRPTVEDDHCFYHNQIVSLIEEMKEAKTKKYIHKDMYVEYRHHIYMDFKKLLKAGEYKEVNEVW